MYFDVGLMEHCQDFRGILRGVFYRGAILFTKRDFTVVNAETIVIKNFVLYLLLILQRQEMEEGAFFNFSQHK